MYRQGRVTGGARVDLLHELGLSCCEQDPARAPDATAIVFISKTSPVIYTYVREAKTIALLVLVYTCWMA